MPHFSRLTDIITCNLTEILQNSENPPETLQEIISEMDEGISACRRTVRTSDGNCERLRREIETYQVQIADWLERARTELSAKNEATAREAIGRKVELEGLVAALTPELEAAQTTCQHMLRIQKALEARYADAARRLTELTGRNPKLRQESESAVQMSSANERQRQQEVDAELEALRRQLGT